MRGANNHRVAGSLATIGFERTTMAPVGHRTPSTPRRISHRPSARTRAILIAATTVALAVLVLVPRFAAAQETTGRIIGHVTDLGTGQSLSGITVILQGPQGEDAALTDDGGEYSFVNLRVGSYVVRFYSANSSTKVERPDVAVSAGATVRADAAIPSQAVVAETYVIKKKAAAVDVGSARLGLTLDENYMQYVPADRTFGDLVLKAPGAFLESSGGVSIAGASGLENQYIMDGLNVTGMEYGDIMNHRADASGGSNLSLYFVKELQVNTGGYSAEFGGAMGGVVNVVTKSGSNEFHGSAFLYWSPYWLSGDPKLVLKKNSALVGVDKPDYDTNFGFELGGPIIKNKLFFWTGFAPRLEKTHFFRDVQALVDNNHDGVQDVDPTTNHPLTNLLMRTRTRELRQSYQYGAKVDYLVAPDHTLTVGLFGTPTASVHTRTLQGVTGGEAVNDPRWAQQDLHKNNTDISAKWVSQLWDRRLRIDAGLGLHREDYSEKSPFSDLNSLNQLEWHNASLFDLEHIPGCEKVGAWDPCPVDNYHNGGFGEVKSYTANRWMADLKSTVLLNRNEIKVGAHLEYNTFDETRYYSGPIGNRGLIVNNQDSPGNSKVWNFFTLPRGSYASQFADASPTSPDPNMDGQPTDLADPTQRFYQDNLVAHVKSVNTAYFIQDAVHPVRNLTVNLGLRLENQKMYDFRGDEFLSLSNLGPRLGVVFDPSDEGRSKIFANYGQFYESIPMTLAARYFGGEGILVRHYDNTSPMCATLPSQWTGVGGEASRCPLTGTEFVNAGAPYPVQANIRAQYHNEVVAGFRHALTQDLVVGIDYTHRWLGSIIEDGTGDGRNFQFVLGNPGDVPKEALSQVQNDIDAKKAILAQTADPQQKAIYQAQLDDLNTKLLNLKILGSEPKPERTYDAITLSATKRLSQRWMLSAFYTYSRLIGNYNGLYDADNGYFAPNGGNAYDTPELVLNRRGPLANDRPHSGRVDGFYQLPVGAKGSIILGGSFSAYSGVPRNYISQWVQGVQLNFLLPRGSAGRTPTVTQMDVKVAYHRELSKTTAMEAFLNLYNVTNERTPLELDDNYTFDIATPIVNGTVKDLQYAKNIFGAPVSKNPNFGQPTVFQQPVHGQLGLRFLF